MIVGSSLIFLIHVKYVVFMCRTIEILILNWPRTRNFIQLLRAGKTVAFDFYHHGHVLVTLYVQFLCSDWSKFDRWLHAENLYSILKLVYFDKWSWQSLYQFVIFLASLFIGFLAEKYVACQSRKSDFGWHRFRFSPCLMPKALKSRMVSLSNHCIWCLFFISNLIKPSVVYAAI